MKKLILFGLMLAMLVSFVMAEGQSEAEETKRIVHFHWTETTYDKINNNAVAMFQAKHPNVEVKILLLPDGDRAAKIRTASVSDRNT